MLRRTWIAERRMSENAFHELFPLGTDDAPYRKLTGDHVSTGRFEGGESSRSSPRR